MRSQKLTTIILIGMALGILVGYACHEAFPDRYFNVGFIIDVLGRLYAPKLAEALDQTWIIENRSGANNTLGAAEVARSAPDGQTFLVNADVHVMAKAVMRNPPYDPIADFTPIARLANAPMVLVGHPRSTPEGIPALVAAMKAPGARHSFANSGPGAMGYPGLDFTLWYAIWAPRGYPDADADRLNAAVRAASRDPAIAARVAEQGAEPVIEDRAAFARFVAAEAERNGAIARAAGIEPE